MLALSLSLPVSVLVLLSAVFTTVADVLTFLADLYRPPGITTKHYTGSQQRVNNPGTPTYYFKQKSQTLDLN